MSSASNVTTAKPKVGGAAYVAPIGTTLPADATTALANTFKGLGYISEDGLTNAESLEVEKIKAWGGDVVAVTQTSHEDDFKFKLIEVLSDEVLKVVKGNSNVTGALATGLTVKTNASVREAHVWVFDTLLRDGALKRIVIPNGTLTEIGDVVYSDSEEVGYDITLSGIADANGNTHYEYIIRSSSSSSSP